MWDGVLFSEPIHPTRGIVAGSAFATFELKAYMVDMLRVHTQQHPQTSIIVHVDDITQVTTRRTCDEAVKSIQLSAAHLMHSCENDLCLSLAKHKSMLLGTNGHAVKQAEKALGNLAGEPAASVENLVIDYALGNKRARGGRRVQNNRWSLFRMRLPRIRRLATRKPLLHNKSSRVCCLPCPLELKPLGFHMPE